MNLRTSYSRWLHNRQSPQRDNLPLPKHIRSWLSRLCGDGLSPWRWDPLACLAPYSFKGYSFKGYSFKGYSFKGLDQRVQATQAAAMPVANRLTGCLSGLLLAAICLFAAASPAQALPGSFYAGFTPPTAPLLAGLPPGNAVTDGAALLRYALPIENPEIRAVQGELEGLSQWLRSKRWGPMKKDLTKVERLLDRKREAILAAVPGERQAEATGLLDQLESELEPIRAAVEAQDKEGVWEIRKQMLEQVGALEELMVNGFPFEVPADYDQLPQLKGRATVEFTTDKGKITAVVDGYSAPVTAGNFVDLVNKKFYDGLPFIRAEDFYVLQTGDPEGPQEGYIDPKTKQYRAIPMEILVKGDEKPIYGSTLEEIGRYMDDPVLPFNAFGSLALARPANNNNGGSSQFFFFLFEAELTPAGRNLLDGRYAVFGYTVEGKDVLRSLKEGDRIISARVVDGLENLELPKA